VDPGSFINNAMMTMESEKTFDCCFADGEMNVEDAIMNGGVNYIGKNSIYVVFHVQNINFFINIEQ